MINTVDLFSALGERLDCFGEDPIARGIITRACDANRWFTRGDVVRAVAALRHEMLQRDKLEKWLKNYAVPAGVRRRVLVVMAGNIPLAGFFDLLCILAAGHHALVKPSGKDLVLIEYIADLLREIDPESRVSFYDDTERPDAVIATGSDNANRYFRARYAEIPALLRGSRQSAAVLSGRETEEQLRGLADDVFAYSGLGCRSVSLVFVPRGYELRLQPPPMHEKYRYNYRQAKALLEMQGCSFRDLGTAVLAEGREFPTALSRINVSEYDSPEQVAAWLSRHDAELQCVVTECLPHPRRTGFGQAQSPSLTDYPDEQDVIRFLLKI